MVFFLPENLYSICHFVNEWLDPAGLDCWGSGLAGLVGGACSLLPALLAQVGSHRDTEEVPLPESVDWEKAYLSLQEKYAALNRQHVHRKALSNDFHFFTDPETSRLVTLDSDPPAWFPSLSFQSGSFPDDWLGYVTQPSKEDVYKFIFEPVRSRFPGATETITYSIHSPLGDNLLLVHNRQYMAHPENGQWVFAHILSPAAITQVNNELLLNGEKMFRLVVQLVPGITVFLFDKEKRFVLVEGGELSKYSYDQRKMEGKLLSEVLNAESLEAVEPYYDRTLNGESIHHLIDTTLDHFALHSVPVFNDRQEIIGGLIASGNITEQVSNEKKIENLSQWFTLVTSVAEVGIWEADFSQQAIRSNATFQQFFGLEVQDDWRAMEHFNENLHPDTQPLSLGMGSYLQHNNGSFDNRYRTTLPDGSVRHLRSHGKVTGDQHGNPLRAVGFDWDITDSVTLHNRLQRLSLFAAQTNNLLMLYTREGEILETNHAYHEQLGGLERIQALFQPENPALRNEAWWRQPETPDLPMSLEARLLPLEGPPRWYNLTLLLLSEGGFQEKTAFLGIAEDISERKIAEKEVIHLVSELWLNNQMIADLTYHLSHRLLHQAANLKGLVSLLDPDAAAHPAQQNTLKYLIQSVAELKKDLHSVSGLMESFQHLPLEPETFNFQELLEDVCLRAEPHLSSNHDQVRISCPDGKMIHGPRAYWRGLLQILVTNVLDRRIGNSPLTLEAVLHLSATESTVTFQDNGAPLEIDELQTGLNGFLRLVNPNQTRIGLGLPFLNVVVNLLQGEITHQNGPSQGVLFTLTLKNA